MQTQHLLSTLNVSLAPSASLLGSSRRHAEWLGHLLGMDTKITRMATVAENPDAFEPALTLSGLAARLRVSAQTIYDLRSQGRGPRGFRVGRQLRFRISEIDAWLARMEEVDAERHPRWLAEMSCPKTPIGAHGSINVRRCGRSVVDETRFRDHDGRVRQIRVAGRTAAAARHRLKERLADRPEPSSGRSLRASRPFVDLAQLWLADLELRDLAEGTPAELA